MSAAPKTVAQIEEDGARAAWILAAHPKCSHPGCASIAPMKSTTSSASAVSPTCGWLGAISGPSASPTTANAPRVIRVSLARSHQGTSRLKLRFASSSSMAGARSATIAMKHPANWVR